MLSAMIPLLHNVMAQAGLAQEPKEHILLHSLGADLAQSPSSPFSVQNDGKWRCPLCAAFWIFPHRKGEGLGGPGRGKCMQVSPCKGAPSRAQHGRHVYNCAQQLGSLVSSTVSIFESCYHFSMRIFLLLYYHPKLFCSSTKAYLFSGSKLGYCFVIKHLIDKSLTASRHR